jgi:hypothetical protein
MGNEWIRLDTQTIPIHICYLHHQIRNRTTQLIPSQIKPDRMVVKMAMQSSDENSFEQLRGAETVWLVYEKEGQDAQ